MEFNLFNPTRQQVFTHILLSLRKQGKASISSDSQYPGYINCAYRGINKTACAIGHCMTDDSYDPKFENNGINGLQAKGFLKGSLAWMAEFEMLEFLTRLQYLHDVVLQETCLQEWEKRMKIFADCDGLIYTEPR